MPWIKANDVRLYYELHGAKESMGIPLLLIAGLGFGAWSWFCQIPVFSHTFTTLAFDNRGVGQSDQPDFPYTIPMMAEDAAALLRGLGIERAHVLGHSMGGYIAQELALQHPELVVGLVLVSTSFGGKNAVLMSPETATQMRAELEAEGAEAVLRKGLSLRLSDSFIAERPDIVDQFLALRRMHLPTRIAWEHQFAACLGFEAESRLAALQAPTLILTGDDDPIVPAENSRLLAERIPNARLVLFPGARHLVFIERAEEFNRTVIEFLNALNRNRPPL